jgi:hypothetical protein
LLDSGVMVYLCLRHKKGPIRSNRA